jgi:hypothetical protein
VRKNNFIEGLYFIEFDGVISHNCNVITKLLTVMKEVESERIEIVDDEDAHRSDVLIKLSQN